MSELNWSYVYRMEAVADRMSQAADRTEAAAQRLAGMLEDGYGGNGLRLIELLENDARGQHKEFVVEMLTLVDGQPVLTRRPLSEWPSWAVGFGDSP